MKRLCIVGILISFLGLSVTMSSHALTNAGASNCVYQTSSDGTITCASGQNQVKTEEA